MSKTVQTLIRAGYRRIGKTPTADEITNGYEALELTLRNWSANNKEKDSEQCRKRRKP